MAAGTSSSSGTRGDRSATGGAGAPALDVMLVERARDGDQNAFRALYERYAPMVHAVLLSHGRRDEADDLMQDVFLAAWCGLHRLRSGDHVGAWLAVIARNRAHRAHGRRRPEPAPLDAEPIDPRGGRDEGREALALLAELPPAYRETLTMRLVEGMTGPEIAEATGLTHGSVRVNLSRGMKLFQEVLRREGWP